MSDALNIKTQARIGRIQYVNTLPFYHNLQNEEGVLVREGYPTQINAWMRVSEIDIAPISSLAYAIDPERYTILPDLCIGSRHFSGSVLLFSRFPIGELNGKTIAVSEESLSSQVLLKIILKKRFQYRNQFINCPSHINQMLTRADAALVIGDVALFHESDEFLYKYDLSEWWYEWTQKPFCFSIWAVRKEFLRDFGETARDFAHQLKENTECNLNQLEVLIEQTLHLTPTNARFPLVYSYLSQLLFEFNDEMRSGLNCFYEYAHACGLLHQMPALDLLQEIR